MTTTTPEQLAYDKALENYKRLERDPQTTAAQLQHAGNELARVRNAMVIAMMIAEAKQEAMA